MTSVSELIFNLVGKDLIVFLNDLIKRGSPTSIKDLMKLIIPPKRIKCNFYNNTFPPPLPADEGADLFSCEGDERILDPPANEDDIDGESSADGVNGNVDDCAPQLIAQRTFAEDKDKDNTTDVMPPSVAQLTDDGQMMI